MSFDDCIRHWSSARLWVFKLFDCEDWGKPLAPRASVKPFEVVDTQPTASYEASYIHIENEH
jgi:hypothetical protein